MLAEERRAILQNKLREDGYIQISDLADEIGISSATIRRDIIALEKEGLCFRKRGGAVRSAQGVTMEIPYEIKRLQKTNEKARIAKAALNLIENGNTILLDAGSTTYALALLLHKKKNLTVVTHDLNIAAKLASIPNINLICTGGIARANVFTLQGTQVVDFIRNLKVDKSFIGGDTIHKDGTIGNVNIEEVPIKQAMIAAAAQVILLADASKFGKTSFAKVADVKEVDIVITDSSITQELLSCCENEDINLIIA